jgi:hypothetical protein
MVFVLQSHTDCFDFLGGAVGEIGERPIFDLSPLAVRLAQEDTAIYRTIGARASRFRDIHNDYYNRGKKRENARIFDVSSDYKLGL